MIQQHLPAQLKNYFFHSEKFSLEEGLHHGVVSDFKIDQNGFIWIHTIRGLQLFDGMNFIDIGPFPGQSVSGRFNPGNYGDIFFATNDYLLKLNEDDYTDTSKIKIPIILNNRPELPDLLYENENYLFILHDNKEVFQVDKKAMLIIEDFCLPAEPRMLISYLYSPESVHPNRMEYLGSDYKLYTIDLNTRATTSLQLESLTGIIKISADTLITADKEYLQIHTAQSSQKIKLPEKQTGISSSYMLDYDAGKLLVSINSNIYEFNPRTLTWTALYLKAKGDNLVDINVRGMKRDKSGNIYFSTLNSGFVKLYPRNEGFRYIDVQTGKRNFAKCVSVSEKNNLVLMGTLANGLLVFDTLGTLLKHYPKLTGSDPTFVVAIMKIDESQFIVFSSKNYLLTANGANITLEEIPISGRWSSYYNQVIEDPIRNQFYASFWHGLADFSQFGKVPPRFIPHHPLGGAHAITIFNDQYLSAFRDTLKLFDHKFEKVLQQISIPSLGYLRCIIQFDSTSVLLGTDKGLYLIHLSDDSPRLTRLYDKMVYSILSGKESHEFWFSTDYGLYRLNKNLELTNFSRELGLQENEFNTNAAYRTNSGKLYFGGVNGITAFYPSEVVETVDKIFPYIASFQVNDEVLDRYIEHTGDEKYMLSHRENNVRVELLARGNKSPKRYNYQYSLKGLHPDWVNMGNDPRINFHLAPGAYTFYYHIADTFDPEAGFEQFVKFIIRQPFYKRWWFVATGMVGALALAYALYKLNRRKHELRLAYDDKLRHKIHKERMRISRELHDNIGAQMATIKRNINFLVSHKKVLPDEQLLQKMKDLEGISSQINQELRDTIWATQQEDLSVQDFITRLKNYVFQTLGPDSDIRVLYLEKCDKEVILGPFLALNLHRICQETISNCIRHSGATELKICFEGHGEYFKVTIIDNGKGFRVENHQEGYGLKNIRHRADGIGADLTYSTDNGTTVEITIHHIEKTNNSLKNEQD